MTPRQGTTTERGAAAECRAASHLRERGLEILSRNYRTKTGEIDLIARDGETLVFVEVRMRSRADYGTPLESVSRAKRQRLVRTAAMYLSNLARAPACRFDVVAVTPLEGEGQRAAVEWIPSAFDADGTTWRG